MKTKEIITASIELMKRSSICFLATNHTDSYPRMKAMLNPRCEGIEKVWLITNTASKRVAQLQKDNKASIYYVDEKNFQGLLLVGTIIVHVDHETREMMWKSGYDIYYPLGVDDPDYAVLEFTALHANYYQGFTNKDFVIQ